MRKRITTILGPLLSVVLFGAALWVLLRELRGFHPHDVVARLQSIPSPRFWTAVGLTAAGYLVMTGYDALALRMMRVPLAYPRIGLASFIGYAFSNNIGLSMIAGASVRYRLYSAWGLDSLQITRLVAFCTLTLWVGFAVTAGTVFVLHPPSLPPAVHSLFASTRTLGALLLAGAAVYAWLCWHPPRRLPGPWELVFPPARYLGVQVVVASLDWLLAAAVLVVLIPSGSVSTFTIVGAFLLAQTVGLISQVPGGLGVFESAMLTLLGDGVPRADLLAALAVYRGVYYLLPLGIAVVLLGTQELSRRPDSAVRRLFGAWVGPVLPNLLSLGAFVAGAVLLFSGALPAIGGRIATLRAVLPLPVLEASHFLASLAGTGLLILSRGLQRRLDAAYFLTIPVLAVGIVTSLGKGLDWEEALVLAVVLAALLPSRRHFYRHSSLLEEPFDFSWMAAVAIAIGGAAALTFVSYRHHELSSDLWWNFAFDQNAPRALRAEVGVLAFTTVFAALHLLRPAPAKSVSARPGREVRAIVSASPATAAHLALTGDKSILLNDRRTAFIMYAVSGRSWVSMGDPVGPPTEWPELIWRFREMSNRYDGRTVFYQIPPESMRYYLDLGLSFLKLGEEARVPLAEFTLEGSGRRNLRQTWRRALREGCGFEVIVPEQAGSLLPDLEAVSDAWLQEKGRRELRFSVGWFNRDYLKALPMALVRCGGRIVGFANLWPGGDREELSIDLMRFAPGAPPGTMDFLFAELMLWGHAEGYRWFNLGMAPLAGMETRSLAPFWNRLAAFIARHGEDLYNFQGLRQYKQKFEPVWAPRYLASPGGLALPLILKDVTALVSGGITGILSP